MWATPNTLAGLVYGGLGHVVGLLSGTHPEITFGNNAVQFTNNPFVNRDSAFTLGNAILYGQDKPPESQYAYGDPDVKTGKHEQAHTHQYEVLGPLFGSAYMLQGGFIGPSGFSRPRGNPFEDAAQDYGSD